MRMRIRFTKDWFRIIYAPHSRSHAISNRFECNRNDGKLIVRENYTKTVTNFWNPSGRRVLTACVCVQIEIFCESKEIIFNLYSMRSISQKQIGHHAYGKLIKSFDWKIKFNLISFELIKRKEKKSTRNDNRFRHVAKRNDKRMLSLVTGHGWRAPTLQTTFRFLFAVNGPVLAAGTFGLRRKKNRFAFCR